MGNERVLSRRFTDISVMNHLLMYDHEFQEIGYKRIYICSRFSYWWAYLSFYNVEYMTCPTYLEHNLRWRLAPQEEAERVFRRYRMSAGYRERVDAECKVYCMDERLEGYHPAPQRAPETYYIVAQSLEIQVSYYGVDFDKLGISHFQ